MIEIKITENESGQRIDRFLKKYLNKANNTFIYKMIRKKNIKLNNKKTDPKDNLNIGDTVQLFLSDETINKFREVKDYNKEDKHFDILYEDKNILFVNKPKGISTQPENQNGKSLVGEILTYLDYNKGENLTFSPAVCNRLDKNTSGIVVAAKNYDALKQTNRVIREKEISKYYLTLVYGELKKAIIAEGYLIKNNKTNKVEIYKNRVKGSKKVITKINPIESNGKYTLLEIELITGRTHQIRAHLFSLGYPLVGERKYTDKKKMELKINYQFLHAYKLELNGYENKLQYLNGTKVVSELPESHSKILEKIGLNKFKNYK